jgi:polysaccharide pyruvyl transferase WcaK-like protein
MCVQTIEKMPSASFLFVPHAKYSRRNLPAEEQLLKRILADLSTDARKRCDIVHLPCDLSDLQLTIQHLDCAISGRMHFAIGLLSAGVPVCCIAYQDKFDGLFRDYLHMPHLLIDMSAANAKGSFIQPLNKLILEIEEDSNRINSALPMIKQLSAKNFQN